tara:strand:+ start:2024 stop:2305 length:282 start_codon:yes stop_codon:yes gene_type:complete
MLEWLKSTWTRWKVQVSFVGGALVLATVYGTCTYEPAAADEAAEEVSATTTTEPETTPVNATTGEGGTEEIQNADNTSVENTENTDNTTENNQ